MNLPFFYIFFTFLDSKIKSIALTCFLFCMMIPIASTAQFQTKGLSIKRAEGCYMITPSQNNVYGAIWSNTRIDLSQPQSFEFEIYLGNKDGNGGEGIAFLFQADPRGVNATGSSGGSLGFGSAPGGNRNNVITPSVAIELDTWNNVDVPADIDVDHTTVVYNGEISSPEFAPVSISPSGANLENNRCHTYSIEWNPATQELKLYFDGNLRFTHRDNIINKVFNGNTSVYYGFTGATGGGRNEQSVRIVDVDSYPFAGNDRAQTYPGRLVTVPVLNNDSHTSGISVSVSRIISAEGGFASVSGNGTSVDYTPSSQTEGVYKVVYEIVEDVPLSCCPKTTTAEIEIEVKCEFFPEAFTISPAGPITTCANRDVNLSVPFHTNATYVWRRNGEVTEGVGRALKVTESGVYSVEVTTMCGKQTSENKVTVVVNPAPPTPVTTDVAQCGFGTVTLTATGGNNGEYRWYTTKQDTPPVPDATNGVYVTPELDSDTTYYVSIVRNGCESERVPTNISMREAPQLADTLIVIEKGESVELKSAEGPYAYKWSPGDGLNSTTISNPTATPSESITYTVEVTSPSGCVVTSEVRVVVREEIVIPNAFSPNGDGINDTWNIPTLEGYPGVKLEVFDRWGNKIFEKVNYLNEWNGTYNGKPLPKGAYMYVITMPDGNQIRGTVNIVY
jgi:gliding motility-associated-like protein